MTIKAKAKLQFIPQKFNNLVLKTAQILLPLALEFRLRPWLIGGIGKIEAERVETLVKLYEQFQQKKIRFLMAFRHPEVEDPLCMLFLMSRIIPRVSRQLQVNLTYPIHTHFIYDRGMTIWAGNWLGWLFSRGGGIPIHRGKPLDRVALKNARDLFINGKFPLTVAPEGATNGHSGRVSPLEPGVAQLGFWCVEDLLKANRHEQVLIVPISIQYYYLRPPWEKLDLVLSCLEADSGLPRQTIKENPTEKPESIFYHRLLKLSEHLLGEMERFYTDFYRQKFPEITLDSSTTIEQVLITRLHNLLDAALKVAEEYFGLSQKGTVIDRCRRLEEVGWNAIYREDITNLKLISPLQKGLADSIAQESDMRLKHMRLVESFVAVSASYIQEKPTVERFAELTLIIYDLMERLKGTKTPRRPRLGRRRVKMIVGEPILVNERWDSYQLSRQGAKQAIARLTEDLYESLISLAT